MYPVYVRGESYLRARQGQAALAEFQKILDHPQLTLTDPVSARAMLGLSHAYELSGDHARSVATYKDFKTLWKSAESGL